MSKFLALFLIQLLAQKGFSKGTIKIGEAQIKAILEIEKIFIENMEKYIRALEQKLNLVSKAAQEMETENNFALLDAEKYLGNPLKSFSLIRRLYSDWKAWHNYLSKPVGEVFVKTMKELLEKNSTHKYLKDATAELRLRGIIYDSQANNMAKEHQFANIFTLNAIISNKALLCYYLTTTKESFGFIAFKLEVLHTNPILLIYHEVLSDSVLSSLIDFQQLYLQPAGALSRKAFKLTNYSLYPEQFSEVVQSLYLITRFFAEPGKASSFEHNFQLTNLEEDVNKVLTAYDIAFKLRKGSVVVWKNSYTNRTLNFHTIGLNSNKKFD